jgi:hydrogenase maturation protease
MAENATLIIGVGNVLRRDDGAGLLLAEAIGTALGARGCPVRMRQVQQLLPELAEEIGEMQPRTLIVADCAAAGIRDQDDVGSMRPLAATSPSAGVSIPVLGSHGLAPGDLLALAQRLYQYRGDAWLVTVPGTNFDHGEGLTPKTEAAIVHLVPLLIERLQ